MEPSKNADAAKRVVAGLADFLLAVGLFLLLSLLAGRFIASLGAAAFLLLRDCLDLDLLERTSPGKRLLNLRVLQERNKPCDHIASIKRNLTLAAFFLVMGALTLVFSLIPFVDPALAVLVATLVGAIALAMECGKLLCDNQRLGDLLAGTRVVDSNDE